MNNKKGFTLVELIAVIAIILLISLIVTPKILNTINNSRNKGYHEIEKRIEEASVKYLSSKYISSDTKSLTITKDELINSGYIGEIYDLKDNSICDAEVFVKNIDNEIEYRVSLTCSNFESEIKMVNIIIELNGGSTTNVQSGIYEEETKLELEIPTKENNVFKGYQLVKGDSTLENNILTVGSSETIVQATWETLVRLDINLDGGFILDDKSGNYKSGTSIDLGAPTKEGYTFIRWEIEEGRGDLSGNLFTIGEEKTTVKAVWEKASYQITYNLNGGSVEVENPTSYMIDTETFKLNNPTKTGYIFKGWTGSNGESAITNVSVSKGSTGNRTYTANWQAKTVTVTFDKNDDSGETLTQTFTYGETGNKFGYNTDGTAKWGTSGDFGSWTRSNYKMQGWATNLNATSKEYNIYSSVTDEWIDTNSPSVTLYAVWMISNPTAAYKCANSSAGSEPYVFTYSSDCTVINDGSGNWRVKFLKTGNFTSAVDLIVDVFVVGGGASGGHGDSGSDNYTKYYGGSGGGSGKTTTKKNVTIPANTQYTITIGAGGEAKTSHAAGGKTTAFGVSAEGGSGKNGGSGGGGGTAHGTASKGGSDGASSSGTGQGTTTKEFGESGGTLYAGAGGGGAGRYGATYGDRAGGGDGGGGSGGKAYTSTAGSGGTNTGGGGGGGGAGSKGGAGGSGIAIIRNKR